MVISGKVQRGIGLANKRIIQCRMVFENYGVSFPPFICGTVNIQLNCTFETPDIGYISKAELNIYPPSYGEYWNLIPVCKVNGKKRLAYILRTSKTCHPKNIIELIAEDIGHEAAIGEIITLELDE